MDPSFQFRQWSTKDIGVLIKSKATIKDIDGDYTLMIAGKISLNCQIAAHYRFPLQALNKRFGLYRKIVNHLIKSLHPLATQLQDTYLSIMDYIHNVRIAFCRDARASPNALDSEFRSPALDYFLWLDHHGGGFHNGCRMNLQKHHDITMMSVKNREGKDIISFRQFSSKYLIYVMLIPEKQSIGVPIMQKTVVNMIYVVHFKATCMRRTSSIYSMQ
jgi:hypothetical protein